MADEEFVGIRDAKGKLMNAAAIAIAAGDENIEITSESLIELVANDDAMKPLLDMAGRAGIVTETIKDDDTALPEIYELSRRLNMT
ncbi:hypothetical protein, partial [Pseudomonas viridiflava]|uniref:hypothetical protein n=1 Tax=Pseudomonas viridiflava TaxID=33069 RepID=UPI0013D78FAA